MMASVFVLLGLQLPKILMPTWDHGQMPRLELAGLDPANIAVCRDCTACMEEKYWSHRRQGTERGSMAAVIELR